MGQSGVCLMSKRMSEKTSASAVRWSNNAMFIALGVVLSWNYSFLKFVAIVAGCALFAFSVGVIRGCAGIMADEK